MSIYHIEVIRSFVVGREKPNDLFCIYYVFVYLLLSVSL